MLKRKTVDMKKKKKQNNNLLCIVQLSNAQKCFNYKHNYIVTYVSHTGNIQRVQMCFYILRAFLITWCRYF